MLEVDKIRHLFQRLIDHPSNWLRPRLYTSATRPVIQKKKKYRESRERKFVAQMHIYSREIKRQSITDPIGYTDLLI